MVVSESSRSAKHFTLFPYPRSSRGVATKATGASGSGMDGGRHHRSLKITGISMGVKTRRTASTSISPETCPFWLTNGG
jgi:hypothetical protein